MVKSGLQLDVIKMYRRGAKLAFSKPKETRPEFLLHLRYNFHNPPLGRRDYTAIEHQLRRMDRTLEMLETGSVQRLHVTDAMQQWWTDELAKKNRSSFAKSTPRNLTAPAKEDVTQRGDSEASGHQWGETLPGRGGT